MKRAKSKLWDKPFYERIEQSKKDRLPRIMRAQGKRLYEIRSWLDKDRSHTNGWTTGGRKLGVMYPICSSWDFKISREKVKVSWLTPKQATLLRLQGATVRELHEDVPEGVAENLHVTEWNL